MKLEHIIGNEQNKEVLTQIVESGQVSHSYLFVGEEGIGKFLFAREFSHMLLCLEEGNNKPCQHCQSCIAFESQNHPDFYELSTKEHSIKIEQIRMLQSKLLEKPIVSKRKVYLINDAEKMTKEAQNALLKTLEEPPEYVCIILIVANESALLNTIKSRCTKLMFQPIEEKELEPLLKKTYGMEAIPPTFRKACGGSIKKALCMYEKKELYQELDNIFYHKEELSLLDVLGKIDALYQNKEVIEELLEYMNILFFEQAKKDKKYLSYIQAVENTKRNLKANANYDMSIDALLLALFSEPT